MTKKEKLPDDIDGVLGYLQANIVATKSQVNTFGKYKYRSCEDILTAAKPLLAELGAFMTLTDDIKLVGDRVYVEATATLNFNGKHIVNRAFAREPLVKKGMDESQITGAASSYARKYALAGLFLLDDNKDADTLAPAVNDSVANNDQAEYDKIVKKHQASIDVIKEGIGSDNLSMAIEAMYELPRDVQIALWRAPTKGGCFSTQERSVIKSNEWAAERNAMYQEAS